MNQENRVFSPHFVLFRPLPLKKLTFVTVNTFKTNGLLNVMFKKSNGCIPFKSNALKGNYITYAVKSTALQCNGPLQIFRKK